MKINSFSRRSYSPFTIHIARMALALLTTLSLPLPNHAQQPAEQVFRAGASTANITPPLGLPIVGNYRSPLATHIHDELHARTLVLDDGTTRLAFVVVDNVGVDHFWIALSKAPVMAGVIAGIGCRQGLETGGDVESLGRRVTAAVVHAIFAIIVIDAIFAMIYMELGL